MGEQQMVTGSAGTAALTAAFRAGDEAAFNALAERHRRELLIHCYRMLGSLNDAEDAVQDAYLRAWRYRESLKQGAPLRPWFYRIATNACLDAIAHDKQRSALAARVADADAVPHVEDVAWLQPIPDSMLDAAAPGGGDPETMVLSRETIEIGFLTIIQFLTPQQRAALILCDVLDWSAKEAAELLDLSVAAVNSALQRARATLRKQQPSRKPEWPAGVDATEAERELMRKYVDATERADLETFESLIREDAIFRMPPQPDLAVGREAMFKLWTDEGFGSERFNPLHCVITRANLQPAVAAYMFHPGDATWRALALNVLRIEEGVITEIVVFMPDLFPTFGLPLILKEPRPRKRAFELSENESE